MTWILLPALAVLVAVFAASRLSRLDPPRRKKALWWLGVAGIVLGIGILARLRLHWIGALGAGAWILLKTLGPIALRLMPLFLRLKSEREKHARNGAEEDATRQGAQTPQHSAAHMTRKEALDILGTPPDASRDEILAAYRRLIRKVHPDAPGGSTYLASKLNQAKDTLLG